MPFIPQFSITSTWRETPAGGHLLVTTITDDEDGRETTMMCPTQMVWADLVVALTEQLAKYEVEHLL